MCVWLSACLHGNGIFSCGWPDVAVLCDVVAPVYVSRGEKDSRVAAQDEIVSRARQGGWPQILIYVEGNVTCIIC